jgi:alpha-1,2-mannosyltransferase
MQDLPGGLTLTDEFAHSATQPLNGPPRWLTPARVCLYASIALVLHIGFFFLAIDNTYIEHVPGMTSVGWDFAVFWNASWLALHGPSVNVFDVSLIESIARPLQNALPGPFTTPWTYPPTFLLVVLPAALLPFVVSYLMYLVLGMAFAFNVAARIFPPVRSPAYWLAIIAFPAVWLAAGAGQNSFLTFGLMGMGLLCLERRPWLAGVFFGLLAIKPQLGLVIPVALLFGRNWRTIASAALTVGALCLLAGLVLGFDTYSRFATALPAFNQFVAQQSAHWPHGISTVFGFSRQFGVPVTAAYLLHAVVAVCAVGTVVWLWAKRVRFELRASALVLATLLTPSYLMPYDLLLLGLPMLWLVRDGARYGWFRGEGVIMVCAWLSAEVLCTPYYWPVGAYAPLPILAMLLTVVRRAVRSGNAPVNHDVLARVSNE